MYILKWLQITEVISFMIYFYAIIERNLNKESQIKRRQSWIFKSFSDAAAGINDTQKIAIFK